MREVGQGKIWQREPLTGGWTEKKRKAYWKSGLRDGGGERRREVSVGDGMGLDEL